MVLQEAMCRLIRTKWHIGFPTLKTSFLLGRLIESSEEQLISACPDVSEFLVRRLEEFK